jgi:hypothetical protein
MVDLNTAVTTAGNKAMDGASSLLHNPKALIIGIILIIAAVVILAVLKNILLNSIIGVAGFLICNYLLGISLPFSATIIVSAIFGAAGLGVILVLKFIGII